ncbi:MAG: hypothetical protein ACI4QT_01750, partial [Kiritimatiellia bacterium]
KKKKNTKKHKDHYLEGIETQRVFYFSKSTRKILKTTAHGKPSLHCGGSPPLCSYPSRLIALCVPLWLESRGQASRPTVLTPATPPDFCG